MNHTVGLLAVRDDKVLIFKHKALNKLSIPAGKCEEGEIFVDAFYREALEEIGVSEADIKFIDIAYTHHKDFHNALFEVELLKEPVNCEEDKHEWMDWISIDGLLAMDDSDISEITRRALEFYRIKQANGGKQHYNTLSFGWVNEDFTLADQYDTAKNQKWMQINYSIMLAHSDVIFDALLNRWVNYTHTTVNVESLGKYVYCCTNCGGSAKAVGVGSKNNTLCECRRCKSRFETLPLVFS